MSDSADGQSRLLAGRRVVVTRAAAQAADLAEALRRFGAEVIACPVLRAEPAPATHLAPLRDRLATYDWLVFTSENGVRGLRSQLAALGLDVGALGAPRVAAVGEATAEAVAGAGLSVDFVPGEFRAEVLVRELLAAHDLRDKCLLRVRGGRASTEVEDTLREAGVEVDVLDSYRTLPAAPDPAVRRDILGRGADAVCFASGSAVDGFERAVAEHGLHDRAVAACNGPLCARAAERTGWRRILVARASSAEALAEALARELDGAR